ncbi:hypothetical protein SAMN05421830_1055 [Desulfomicrobium norvegicum]|uniref:Response regulator receiver protein n=1 Tax=Desulfomicrobium norvegicum (strain DSM 1741 / NCIMB 8310) TaxID=52561 RepID=A0A8G2F4C7_DESNO|nr:hypothetical protein [Desulfomicrobium norvegicum]SFL69379.1 hypothetical protein SAMN05421830_1055 [Desulfomicrobium norvegicum]
MNLLQEAVSAKNNSSTHGVNEKNITPLRKRSINGDLYIRVPKIESLIAELLILPRDELIARAKITHREDDRYVPSECLVYFIRTCRHDGNAKWFERIYKILIERVLRSLPKAENTDGKTESLSRGAIRDYVFDRFVELLSADRSTYNDKLDFFEVRFDSALTKLRYDAQDKVWLNEKRFQPLEYEEKNNELSVQVEMAAGTFDPTTGSGLDDADYRSRFDAAINTLPPEQARIIHMLRLGVPIDSKVPNVMTIAKALNRSEKTIRTYRDKAFSALRAAMANGEEQ